MSFVIEEKQQNQKLNQLIVAELQDLKEVLDKKDKTLKDKEINIGYQEK